MHSPGGTLDCMFAPTEKRLRDGKDRDQIARWAEAAGCGSRGGAAKMQDQEGEQREEPE